MAVLSEGMEQEKTAEAKQAVGGDERQQLVVSSQNNAGEKAEPSEGPKPASETEKLIEFMGNHYERLVAGVQSLDEFYHADVLRGARGKLQYRIRKKETLLESYNRHHTSDGQGGVQFVEMSKEELLRRESFSLGKATVELAMLLFGVPACAFAAKRILPGLGWVSDDVAIPLATSASVA
ncbi:hypothetical protein U9M48_016462 [Paspalum notatum var. saurae]|uniref:Uncharacterized protein n=1 Tax=Paspalum notatum var. saurae TaxID=547442 RepID=A0AAQ3WN47_PASNO